MAFKTLFTKPKLVQELLKTLPYSARPMFVNGRWRKPKLSARQLAALKKAAMHFNFPWPMKEIKKIPKKHGFIKPLRGSTVDRRKEARIESVNKKLLNQNQRYQKIKEEERKERYKDYYNFEEEW